MFFFWPLPSSMVFLTVHCAGQRGSGIAMGVLAIITGVVFLVDFLFAIKNTRFGFTSVQTRVVV
jgi:hypothetical protein